MTFYSRKDPWLIALIWSVALTPLLAEVYLIGVGLAPRLGPALMLNGLLTQALILGLTYPLYYRIGTTGLAIRSRLLRGEVPLEAITDVSPTRSLLASPAWLLDRLRISYTSTEEPSEVLVSPADRLGFMQELARATPGLDFDEGRLSRRRELIAPRA